MKKYFLVALAILIVLIVVVYLKVQSSNTSEPTDLITLRISGANLKGSVGWNGEHTSPVTYDIAYKDITNIPINLFDGDLLTKTGNTQDGIMSYARTHKDNIVYVALSKKNGDNWYTPDLVTDNKVKVSEHIFIKGKVDGSSGPYTYTGKYGDKTLSFGVVYSGIQNSQDIITFVDLFAMSWRPTDNITAQVLIDKNGNSALSTILVNDKTCVTKGNTDLNDKECWNDFRAQRQNQKKYTQTFLPLLFRKFGGY